MEYDAGYHLLVERLNNLYKTNLMAKSFTALIDNLMYGRRMCLLEQILRLYRKKSLLKRGISALHEQTQIKKLFYTIADRQLVGNFLLRWHSHFLDFANIRAFRRKWELNLLKRCFNKLYHPIKVKYKWKNTIGKVELLLFIINSHSFFRELTYCKNKKFANSMARKYYEKKLLKKAFVMFTKHLKFNYYIDSVEQILQQHLLQNFFNILQKINIILDKENTVITLFKKKIIFVAWRNVVLDGIAEQFHAIITTRIFFIGWRNAAVKVRRLNLIYGNFIKKSNRNLMNRTFNNFLKVLEYRKNLIYYFEFLEAVCKRSIIETVFDNFRSNSQTLERLKMITKTCEVTYSSSLKSKSMASLIKYVSNIKKKRYLKEIGEIWSVNYLKYKYFYTWQSEIVKLNAINVGKVKEFAARVLLYLKKRYFTHWLQFSTKMNNLRIGVDEFITRDKTIVLSYFWDVWVKNYAISKQKTLDSFIGNEIFDEFGRAVSLYPKQLLLLFSSPCADGIKNTSTQSAASTKSLELLVENLDTPLPNFYNKFNSFSIICRYHDKLKYSCLLTIPKWKSKLISFEVRQFRHKFNVWRNYVSDKLAENKMLQALTDRLDKSRRKRLISYTFYAWVELMAVCYANKREQFLALVAKFCTAVEKPITRNIRFFIFRLKEIKYFDYYHKNILRMALASFRKNVLINKMRVIVEDRHSGYLLKYYFMKWGNYVFDRQLKLLNATLSVKLLIKRRFFGYIKLAVTALKINRLRDANLVEYFFSVWTKVHLSLCAKKKVLNNLLKKAISGWRNVVRVEIGLRGLESQANEIYESKLLDKSFNCWLVFSSMRIRISAAHDVIEKNNRINTLKFLFNKWLQRAILIKKLNYFSIIRERRYATSVLTGVFHHLNHLSKLAKLQTKSNQELLNSMYSNWKIATAKIKFINSIEVMLGNRNRNECSLFISQLKQFYSWFNKLQQYDTSKKTYQSLQSLANISKYRIELGLKCLVLNVKINSFIKSVDKRILGNCYNAIYNYYFGKKNERIVLSAFECKLRDNLLIRHLHAWIKIFNLKVSIMNNLQEKARNEEMELLMIYFSCWRKYTTNSESKAKLKNVMLWVDRRRAAEGFRRLRQFTMDRKWQAVCSHQASIFRAIRDVARIKIAFSAWRNVVANKSDSDYDYIDQEQPLGNL